MIVREGRAMGVIALTVLCLAAEVTAFSTSSSACVRDRKAWLRAAAARPNTSPPSASSTQVQDISTKLGDRVATALVNSRAYPFLIRQAKSTMKKSAQNIGVDWDNEVAQLRDAQNWDAALDNLLDTSPSPPPEYYKKPFHAYADGNLCWQAAWEQHLASKAVGVRNFPNDAMRGEHLLRKSFEEQIERLGVLVDEGGVIADFGCGTGTSTRYLAGQFPQAAKIVGFDLSPHMVLTGQYMNQKDEKADPRVELRYADAAKTDLPDNSVSMVSLCLLVHELAGHARREIFAEAYRILRPGGSLAMMEMDPSAPGYVKLRNNPMLFAILRSTEPYLEEWFSQARDVDVELQEAGFPTVRKSMATGRHFTVLAVKGGSFDVRGTSNKEDTHVQSHQAGVWIKNPVKSVEG